MNKLSDHPLPVILSALAAIVSIIGFLGITSIKDCSSGSNNENKEFGVSKETNPQSGAIAKKCGGFSFISFIDIGINYGTMNSNSDNIARVKTITDPICNKYLLDDAICSLEIKVYPLYYNTGELDFLYFKDRNFVTSNLELHEEQKIIRSFYGTDQIDKFQNAYCNNNAPSDKNIWKSIYRISDLVSDSDKENIILIFYSDFLEENSQTDIGNSIYSFSIKKFTGEQMLDCQMIQQATKDLNDASKPMGQALLQSQKSIINGIKGKNVKIVLVKRRGLISNDGCSFSELENYWSDFFKNAGFDGVEIIWLSNLGFTESFLAKTLNAG